MDFRDRYLSQKDKGKTKISPKFPIAVPTSVEALWLSLSVFLFLLLLLFPVSCFLLGRGVRHSTGEFFWSFLLFPLQMRIILIKLHRSFYSDKRYVVYTGTVVRTQSGAGAVSR